MATISDHFEALGIERQLDLSPETLRTHYDGRCQEAHPDAGGTAKGFDAVTEAYKSLASPARRLRHWLELSGITVVEDGSLPPAVEERFDPINELLRAASEIAERHREARSTLVRSVAEAEGIALQPRIAEARGELENAIAEIVSGFKRFDQSEPCEIREEAMEVVRSLSFLERWEAQLRAAWAKAGCW